ncbi:purple acid phosphatase family protein [Microseira wollei]|uniref:Metallophosphoesterase n=1 Tax=Microseira wollei NIES-4236 TaxID=2530354 RepID=A0AAV3X8S5_9CYAN|nr:metallophosphoesterase family protein [Microseira wollei]GET37681.1 metallophosphoesterase [Microseira wollei NIES-4236]
MLSHPQLLTDPFLQRPTENSVRVVWFTEFAGSHHIVAYGENFSQIVTATTTKLSRAREDQNSQVEQVYQQTTRRHIWRHEAEVTGLIPNTKVPYRVTSVREDGQSVSSNTFALAAKPLPGMPLKILLTSDHQLKPMTAANLQKVVETVGVVDAVFFAGDLVNVPDRASEWFDDRRGCAFFPCLQGRANYQLTKNNIQTLYQGGELIQNAPIFTAIGNHEVMGRFSSDSCLDDQFDDTLPRQVAEKILTPRILNADVRNSQDSCLGTGDDWVKDYSFNTDTYEEIFTLPESQEGGKKYYAVTFGDVRLVVLYVTNMWRTPSLAANARGKYKECDRILNNPENWGYGQHIFEPIKQGSTQYQWLESELNSVEFKRAKYKVVMFHHPAHTLGDHIVPAYTDPVQIIERDADGNIKAVRYEYPKQQDYIIRDLVPLLETSGVQLVLYGHSHLWNRFVSNNGTHYLETSNVGNSYGAALSEKQRTVPSGYQQEYTATGNPYGLEPVVPAIAPLLGSDGQPLPYVASNDITAFSILDTETGIVSSYRFDTRNPDREVLKFDEFRLKSNK